jgi:hypothetical protein
MLPGEQLALICYAIQRMNHTHNCDLKLIVLGDAAQLPTFNAHQYFFETKIWQEFNHNSLVKVKRQDNLEFINFLNCLRMGKITEQIDWFETNINFCSQIQPNFAGTTILSTNKRVNAYNQKSLADIKRPIHTYPNIKLGKLKPEWKEFADHLVLKEGCKVILTVNDHELGFANGDLATVRRCFHNAVEVEIKRTKRIVMIGYIERKNVVPLSNICLGTLKYIPLKLAYSLTVHRTQGLTLEAIQCQIGDPFLNSLSGGLYVLFSRIRDYRNLRVVGNRPQLIKANYIDPKIKSFLESYGQGVPGA